MISIDKIAHILMPVFATVTLVYMSCGGKTDSVKYIGFEKPKPINPIEPMPDYVHLRYYEYDGHVYVGDRLGSNYAIFTHSGTCTNPIHFQNCK